MYLISFTFILIYFTKVVYSTDIWSEYINVQSIENGSIKCTNTTDDPEICQINCEYGFITSGKHVFHSNETAPTCTKTLAFIIGGQSGYLSVNHFRSDIEIYSTTWVENIPSTITDFPYKVELPIAFWYDGYVLVCGGRNVDSDQNEDRCWKYDACENEWTQSAGLLNERRKNAAGRVLLPDIENNFQDRERPWILGGEVSEVTLNASLTPEYYDGYEWIKNEEGDLQEEKFGACTTVVSHTGITSSDEIVLIGGKKTFREVESFLGKVNASKIANPFSRKKDAMMNKKDDWGWLNHGRYMHACESFPMTVIPDFGKPYTQEAIIVAGGRNDQLTPLDTVEIWYSDEGIWKEGENLHDVRFGAGMVILNGMPTLLGGSNKLTAKDEVYGYDFKTEEWIEKPTLETTRTAAGIVAVPDTLFSQCNFENISY